MVSSEVRRAISRAFHASTSPALTRSHSCGNRCRMPNASPINRRAATTLDCCANANDDGQVSATSGVPSGPILHEPLHQHRRPCTSHLGIGGLAVAVRPCRGQHQLAASRPPLGRMVVRSQAEQLTRIPERLLQPLIEHTDDYSLASAAPSRPDSEISLVCLREAMIRAFPTSDHSGSSARRSTSRPPAPRSAHRCPGRSTRRRCGRRSATDADRARRDEAVDQEGMRATVPAAGHEPAQRLGQIIGHIGRS